ncbi:MAG: hypothetical protein ACTHON_05325 [Humibacter sp.]
MTTPAANQPPIVWDIVLSIVVWVMTGALIGIATFVALFGLAFIDYCPPASCSANGALLSLMVAGVASVVVALAGLAGGLVLIVQHRISWWVTVGAFVLCLACWVAGFVGAAKAIGW